MTDEVQRLKEEWLRLKEAASVAHDAYSKALKESQPFHVGDTVLAYKGYGVNRHLHKAEIVSAVLRYGDIHYVVAWYKKDGTVGKQVHEIYNFGGDQPVFPLDYVEPEKTSTPITKEML